MDGRIISDCVDPLKHHSILISAATISDFDEVTDFYLASQVCQSFLIAASTSTFRWWLAFFIKDQNAVFYMLDNRAQTNKVPSKESLAPVSSS
ncbi:hypothetical protein KIN20_024310 [Parelaphostrongylus tenuis]|uniref:Uncharacterized protein n=1 Tax=Parelaphostrongylus tenuis TaxID=148309 RepID=A0AAD5NCR2_PARTN|nr:hypothetical protein KIN20_024310 [Parelaphostrongylus tenuis]